MKQPSQSQLDAMAKQKGFRDYATWSAWNKKYRQKRKGGSATPDQKPVRNVFERIVGHPANTLRRVSDRINQAIGE